jgi:hypothetical protein
MLEDIQSQGYRLIIDENVDVLEQCKLNSEDIQLLMDGGYLQDDGDAYSSTGKVFNGSCKEYRELLRTLRTRKLIRVHEDDGIGEAQFYFWILPKTLLTSFKDVIILTYMFECQSLHHFLKMSDLKYEYIGVRKKDGAYSFCPVEDAYTPEYVSRMGQMIHIVDNDRLNAIGNSESALSHSWFERNRNDSVKKLKKAVNSVIRYEWKDIPAEDKLWGSFKNAENNLRGRGYSKAFLVFNSKAINDYGNRHYIVYAANVFMNVTEKIYYQKNGIDCSDDEYAISTMVQWIWRSAIRNGDEIYIYIPSSRMRRLLKEWIGRVSS